MTDTSFTINLGKMDPVGSSSSTTLQGKDALVKLLGNISEFLLFLIPLIAVISILIAGYFYIFSVGDSEKTGRAKGILKWNLIAILVAFLAYGLLNIIRSFF
jgi:Type IV secretion system pilin